MKDNLDTCIWSTSPSHFGAGFGFPDSNMGNKDYYISQDNLI